jgi:cytoskeletal protein RodZ
MQSVGTRLREARIKKGYTLDDINARTRISLKNLNAIESDDLSKISSPFTYRSFVKQVCDLVGLDHATVAADAVTASSTMPEPLVPGQEEEVYVRPQQYQVVKPKANLNWLRMVSIAGAVGLVFIYLIWRNGGIEAAKLPATALPASSRAVTAPDSASSSSQPLQQQQMPASAGPGAQLVAVSTRVEQPPVQPEAQPPVVAPNVPPGTEQLLPPPTHAEARAPAKQTAPLMSAVPKPAPQDSTVSNIHIELSAIQSTWLSISADGKTTYSGTLGAMKTMSFDGKETAQIRTANAGGVNIIFNGRALGPLGRRGQSRTFVFTKDGYEVVQGLGNLHTGG